MSSSLVGGNLSASERRARIKEGLAKRHFVSVRGLLEEFGVSDMTIRRDFRLLEEEGALRIVHGGASLPDGADYQRRGQTETDAKDLIARRAVSLIPAGATILMDAGTTVAAVAKALPLDFSGYIITHSVPVIEAMISKPSIQVHCLGGELRAESRAMIGPTTLENLAKVSAQVLVLGAAAIDEQGVFVDKDLERGVKSALIASSQHVILVADHTKFSKFSAVLLAPLKVIDEIVTDLPLPHKLAEQFRKLKILVHIVGAPVETGASESTNRKA